MSKGSAARPFAVDRDTFASNFDAIFGKKKIQPKADAGLMYDAVDIDAEKPQEARSAPAYGLDDVDGGSNAQ